MLSEVTSLDPDAIAGLTAAQQQVAGAQASYGEAARTAAIAAARDAIAQASASIGTNLTYDIGAGTVMF